MKKRLLSFLFIIFLVSGNIPATAQTKTPTPSPSTTPTKSTVPTDSEALEKIQRIKDIVASKVAELNLVEKRGIIGRITESSSTQITVKDLRGNKRIIDIDELTKFEGKDKDDELGVSDLKKNINYSFIGIYNKDTRRLLARVISESTTIPVNIDGVVTAINEDEFQIEVVDEEGNKKNVDIERSTKTSTYNEDDELVKSGFSQIQLNERVMIVGFTDTDDDTLISASRVIHFSELPPSKKMQSFVELEEDANVSSGSGRKLETKSIKEEN